MKNLKKFFAVIAIIIAIPLVVALFCKKKTMVERKIIIINPKPRFWIY